LLFAPDSTYGRPEEFKGIDAGHAKGIRVFLDVVYNHFGPDGNYLNAYFPILPTNATTLPTQPHGGRFQLTSAAPRWEATFRRPT
jgi:1,4-alpha-glucan branching enzyme